MAPTDGLMPYAEGERNHNDKSDAKNRPARSETAASGSTQPGKVDFGNDVLVLHHHVGAVVQRGRKICPGNYRGKIEDGIRQTLEKAASPVGQRKL